MSSAGNKTRTIKVDCLARVEGEGALYIKLIGDRVADVKLKIFEPPRLLKHFSAAGTFPKRRTSWRGSAEFARSPTR